MSNHEKSKEILARTLSGLVYAKTNNYGWYGNMLQSMVINFTDGLIPTAGVRYNEKTQLFEMYINPKFFIDVLKNDAERQAVLLHELHHILFKHVIFQYPGMDNKQRLNIAMDLAINQFIANLPEHAYTIDKMRDKNGKPFKANQITEAYYHLLDNAEVNKGGNNGEPDKWEKVKYEHEFDNHEWENASGSATEADKLGALKDLIKRTENKSVYNHSTAPAFVKDLLTAINARLEKLNIKAILAKAFKQTMPAKDSKKSWSRPSRRYGTQAQGNVTKKLPKLTVYLDTSGSISINEFNEFITVVRDFFKFGVQTMHVAYFHTNLYKKDKLKPNFTVVEKELESGGTDLQCVTDDIVKSGSDINVILTDGYYGDVSNSRLPPTVFVISRGGNMDHPLKRLGTTVQYF